METFDKKEAISKLSDLVKNVRICMMATINSEGLLSSRPMTTIDVDDNGSIWFYTDEYSGKVSDQLEDDIIYLMYAHPGENTYVHIQGKSSIINDKQKIKALWNPLLKAWYPKGVDDPQLCLMKVTPDEARYWDSSSSKMVVFFNMLKAIVKHEEYKEGETQTLKLNKGMSSIH